MENHMKNSIASVMSVYSFEAAHLIKLDGTKAPKPDIHDFPELLFVEKGVLEVYVDDVPHIINAGQIIIYAPNSLHQSKTPQNATLQIVSFEIDSDCLSELYNRPITLTATQKDLFLKVFNIALESFADLPPESEFIGMIKKEDIDAYALHILKNSIELLLIDIYNAEIKKAAEIPSSNLKRYKSNQFNSIVKYMQDNICEPLTSMQICAKFKISASTLKALFKEYSTLGPKAYFINLKIEESKKMIRDTSMNFTEISTKLGFSSLYYFSKLFKEKTGFTPSEYSKSVYKRTD